MPESSPESGGRMSMDGSASSPWRTMMGMPLLSVGEAESSFDRGLGRGAKVIVRRFGDLSFEEESSEDEVVDDDGERDLE